MPLYNSLVGGAGGNTDGLPFADVEKLAVDSESETISAGDAVSVNDNVIEKLENTHFLFEDISLYMSIENRTTTTMGENIVFVDLNNNETLTFALFNLNENTLLKLTFSFEVPEGFSSIKDAKVLTCNENRVYLVAGWYSAGTKRCTVIYKIDFTNNSYTQCDSIEYTNTYGSFAQLTQFTDSIFAIYYQASGVTNSFVIKIYDFGNSDSTSFSTYTVNPSDVRGRSPHQLVYLGKKPSTEAYKFVFIYMSSATAGQYNLYVCSYDKNSQITIGANKTLFTSITNTGDYLKATAVLNADNTGSLIISETNYNASEFYNGMYTYTFGTSTVISDEASDTYKDVAILDACVDAVNNDLILLLSNNYLYSIRNRENIINIGTHKINNYGWLIPYNNKIYIYTLNCDFYPGVKVLEEYDVETNTLKTINPNKDAIALESGSSGDSISVGFEGYCQCPGVTQGDVITSDGVVAYSPEDGWLNIIPAYRRPAIWPPEEV